MGFQKVMHVDNYLFALYFHIHVNVKVPIVVHKEEAANTEQPLFLKLFVLRSIHKYCVDEVLFETDECFTCPCIHSG